MSFICFLSAVSTSNIFTLRFFYMHRGIFSVHVRPHARARKCISWALSFEISQTCYCFALRSVNSLCNKNGSKVNSVFSAEVPLPFTLIILSFLLERKKHVRVHGAASYALMIHAFRGCPCLRWRRASAVSPCRTQFCCSHSLCSPRSDPRIRISFWDAVLGPSVSGSGRPGKSSPERAFSLWNKNGSTEL